MQTNYKSNGGIQKIQTQQLKWYEQASPLYTAKGNPSHPETEMAKFTRSHDPETEAWNQNVNPKKTEQQNTKQKVSKQCTFTRECVKERERERVLGFFFRARRWDIVGICQEKRRKLEHTKKRKGETKHDPVEKTNWVTENNT